MAEQAGPPLEAKTSLLQVQSKSAAQLVQSFWSVDLSGHSAKTGMYL